jgi:hypothetical protein
MTSGASAACRTIGVDRDGHRHGSASMIQRHMSPEGLRPTSRPDRYARRRPECGPSHSAASSSEILAWLVIDAEVTPLPVRICSPNGERLVNS